MKTAKIIIAITFSFLFIGVIATYIIANKNFEPVMNENYYKIGLDYQKHLDTYQKARSLGIHLHTNFPQTAKWKKSQVVSLEIINTQNTKTEIISANLSCSQAATLKGKIIKTLNQEKTCKQAKCSHRFTSEFVFPKPGRWECFANISLKEEMQLSSQKFIEVY